MMQVGRAGDRAVGERNELRWVRHQLDSLASARCLMPLSPDEVDRYRVLTERETTLLTLLSASDAA